MPKLSDPPQLMIAPTPVQLLPRSIATPSLLASVLIGKFCDALPFYRQERMFSRFGLEISRQDMANWAIAVAAKLTELIALMKDGLLSGPFLHCDETFFQVMDEEGRNNTTQSYMWVLTGGEGTHRVVLYRYNPTREATFISTFLASYEGFLQTDGYDGYNAIGEKDGIIHVACWAHARRRFVEAFKAANKKGSAGEAIELIGKMYSTERTLREKYFGEHGSRNANAFVIERKKLVEPVLEELKAWLDTKVLEVLPKSALSMAISYTLDIWPRLIRYLDCPWLRPDNNEAERAIRPFTIGRNYAELSIKEKTGCFMIPRMEPGPAPPSIALSRARRPMATNLPAICGISSTIFPASEPPTTSSACSPITFSPRRTERGENCAYPDPGSLNIGAFVYFHAIPGESLPALQVNMIVESVSLSLANPNFS